MRSHNLKQGCQTYSLWAKTSLPKCPVQSTGNSGKVQKLSFLFQYSNKMHCYWFILLILHTVSNPVHVFQFFYSFILKRTKIWWHCHSSESELKVVWYPWSKRLFHYWRFELMKDKRWGTGYRGMIVKFYIKYVYLYLTNFVWNDHTWRYRWWAYAFMGLLLIRKVYIVYTEKSK